MLKSSKTKILFQLTGSIAAYKACSVISRLVQNNCDVQIVASSAALNFVGPATLEGLTGRSIQTDLYETGKMMDHIHLVRWADLIVTAPATANYINKLASGIADDLLSTLWLAYDFKRPFLIAPAMNSSMLEHPITQSSLEKLKVMGIQILQPESGALACGETGTGRLMEPEQIFEAIMSALPNHQKLTTQGKDQAKFSEFFGLEADDAAKPPIEGAQRKIRVLITSGGTQEKIDPVRRLTNISTGKTGSKIADQLIQEQFLVTFLHGENSAVPSLPCELISFSDFKDLDQKLTRELSLNHYDWIIQAAAISDYSVKAPSEAKLSSDAESLTIELEKNPKLISKIKKISKNKNIGIVGFKLTAGRSPELIAKNISSLFAQSSVDFVVHNDLSEMQEGHIFHLHDEKNEIARVDGAEKLGKTLSHHLKQENL